MGGAGCCDDKAFGAPCADCAFDATEVASSESEHSSADDCPMCDGRVGADSTAAHALSFATNMLEGQTASVGHYWQRQAVANMVANAAAGPSDKDDHGAVSSYIASGSHGQQAAGFWSSTESGLFWRPPWRISIEYFQDKWPGVIHVPFFDPENPASDANLRCCIEEISYPLAWSKFVISYLAHWLVGVQFEAWIEYKDGGGCWCDCCEFKQFVESKTRGGAGGPNDPPTPGVPHEDSYDEGTGERSGQTGRDPEGSARSFGGRQDWHASIDTPAGLVLFNDSQRTRCDVYILDTPSEVVPSDTAFSQKHEFTGRVYDKCHNNKIVATEKFSIKIKGRTRSDTDAGDPPTSGEIEVQAHDGVYPNQPTHNVAQDGTRTRINE